jgi:hypothetical protein
VYPPTITTAVTGYAGASLFNRLTVAHGYLTKQVSTASCATTWGHSIVVPEIQLDGSAQSREDQACDRAVIFQYLVQTIIMFTRHLHEHVSKRRDRDCGTSQGFCDGKDCQTFIVVPGEFGSRMVDPRDLQVEICCQCWSALQSCHMQTSIWLVNTSAALLRGCLAQSLMWPAP